MTNQTNNGNVESSNHSETLLEKIDKILEEYEKSVGISFSIDDGVKNEVSQYMSLTPSQLKKMSAEDCAIGAFLLERFSFHLQHSSNKEQGRITWSNECTNKIITPLLSNQKTTWFKEKEMLAKQSSETVQKLEKIRVNAQLRIDRLSYLSQKVSQIAKTLSGLQMAKNYRREND